MIESDSQTECSHLLLVVVKDDEVSINAIILSDQMQQGYSHVA